MPLNTPADFSDVNGDLPVPQDQPKPVFELGLVLGGTVSAGAYTAGFLDFLIEALDAFHEEGDQPFSVRLKVISGTSGGGMVAAQTGRLLYRDFPHVTEDLPEAQRTQNLLYDAWVDRIDITHLLDCADLDGSGKDAELASLLNCARIDEIAQASVGFQGKGKKDRSWVGGTLDVIVTMFNMRGVPLSLPYADGVCQSFLEHADYMRFGIFRGEQNQQHIRPDALAIDSDWGTYGTVYQNAAVATGAFPGFLKARVIERKVGDYLYRWVRKTVLKPDGSESTELVPLPLDSELLAGLDPKVTNPEDSWKFVAVDGGVANNEPVELARTTLAGPLGRNPRAGDKACRAVVMVAPVATRANVNKTYDSEETAGAFEVFKGLPGAMIDQCRFSTADLELAGHPDVYSRFIAVPERKKANGEIINGENALACSGLGAFFGFFEKASREHDFFLGRYNAWKFLTDEFCLPVNNPLFDKMPAGEKEAKKSGDGFLPIVPLTGSAVKKPTVPAWPTGPLKREGEIDDLIEKRVDKLLDKSTDLLPLSCLGSGVVNIAEYFLAPRLAKRLVKVIDEAVEARDKLA